MCNRPDGFLFVGPIDGRRVLFDQLTLWAQNFPVHQWVVLGGVVGPGPQLEWVAETLQACESWVFLTTRDREVLDRVGAFPLDPQRRALLDSLALSPSSLEWIRAQGNAEEARRQSTGFPSKIPALNRSGHADEPLRAWLYPEDYWWSSSAPIQVSASTEILVEAESNDTLEEL